MTSTEQDRDGGDLAPGRAGTDRLNVGCGPHYAEGWLNTDVIRIPGTVEPDIVVEPENSLPFEPGTFDLAYVGHILEHIAWAEVPAFLVLLDGVCTDDARVMFVGPDTDRAVRNFANGISTWHDVQIALEGPGAYTEATGFSVERWAADRHHWNCTEARILTLLEDLGWRDVTCWPVDEEGLLPELDGWPLVSRARNQFAVSATIPRRI